MLRHHKEVIYLKYGVTLKTGLHRIPILCRRIAPIIAKMKNRINKI